MSDPILWCESFLKNLKTGENLKLNYVEKRILSSKSDRVVIRVSRRSGKSFSLSCAALYYAMTRSDYEVLFLAPDDGKISEIFFVLIGIAEASPIVWGSKVSYTKSPHTLILSNKSRILGKTLGSSSNSGGRAARGFGADLLILDEVAYLKENDFTAIEAIITGDTYRDKVRTLAASTPTEVHGTYYNWCKDDTGTWEEIHIPITENPDYTPEQVTLRRAVSSERGWITEYCAEFLDAGMNVFKHTDIEAAQEDYRYFETGNIRVNAKRAMGVDSKCFIKKKKRKKIWQIS